MNQYYGVTRSDAYLAHYGVKGMKWGVRKALYNNDARALRKHYQKAAKKLAKLEKRGNSGAKYAARAGLLGAGAAAVGGMAFNNSITRGVGKVISPISRKIFTKNAAESAIKATKGITDRVSSYARADQNKYTDFASKVSKQHKLQYYDKKLSKRDPLRQIIYDQANTKQVNSSGIGMATKDFDTKSLTRRQYNAADLKKTRLEAGKKAMQNTDRNAAKLAMLGIAGGLAGAAGYNAYRAATTKRARRKASEFRKAMNETFAGTEYEKLGGLPLQKQKRKRRR